VAIEFIRTISQGKKIYGILHLPRNLRPSCVVCSHGLFSSKDSEKFVQIGDTFSDQGIAVIRYDHQGCGESEGELSTTTATSRLKDLKAIVDLAAHHPLLGNRLGLLGSSMGGFISIFKASVDPRVKALALWATPALLEGGKEVIEREEEARLPDSFYDDAKGYDAGKVIQGVSNCLFLHGEADELVPFAQAETLYKSARPPKHLEIFPGGDHRFTDPQHRRRAIQMSLKWFQWHL
jgi:alpha-beta hydrolase superfamily lysophospholipase